MKTSVSVTIVVLALAAVACGPTGGVPPTPRPGQTQMDALAVWSAEGTSIAVATAHAAQATADTAAAWAAATASAVQATADAQAQATAVAQVTAAAATASWDTLLIQEKAVSVQQTADAGVYALSATATAEADIAAFMRAEAAQTLAERQAEAARRAMWTRLTPWLLGAVVLMAAGVIFLVMVERIRRVTPQAAGDTWVMWHPDVPRIVSQPQAALPRVEPVRALLNEGAAPTVERPVALPHIPRGHMLIAGETGSGKSTAAAAVAVTRANVRVLDPHWNGTDWPGLEVIGGGRDFEAIRASMDAMREMLRARYAERLDGRDDFEPFTVFVDEMPAIVSALGREVRDFWREWLREGRKVGLYLVLLTQSTRVRTLGIEGERDVLENFGAVLVLGKLAVAEHPQLVGGMARPAVLQTMGEARPVVIPHAPGVIRPTPARPTPPAPNVVIELPQNNLPPVYAATDWPRRPEPPIDPNNIDARARQRMVDEYGRTLIFRRTQLTLFPQYADDGGYAGAVLRRVLAEEGMIQRDAKGNWQPTAKALNYNELSRMERGPSD